MSLRTGGLLLRGIGAVVPSSTEPFSIGTVGVDAVEPFDIERTAVGAEWIEPFTIEGGAGAESIEPFMLGQTIYVESEEPFDIVDSTIGGYLGTSPASPLLGWRER